MQYGRACGRSLLLVRPEGFMQYGRACGRSLRLVRREGFMQYGRACGRSLLLVRPEGFEPPTFRSVAGRSNPLSYGRMIAQSA
jgi:hypothetical protein